MRGLTREELGILRDLASPDMHHADESRMCVDEALVEQGRAVERVISHDENYEHVEWHISQQGIEALNLYALIGERMLT